MNALIHHFTLAFRSGLRDKQLFIVNYIFPLAFYFFMGLVMTDINPAFTPTLVPAMVVLAIMFATLMGIPDPLVKAREDGILRSYRINGVPVSSTLVIPLLSTLVHMLMIAAIILVTAGPVFDAPLPSEPVAFLGTLLAMTFACAGLGTLIGVLSPSTTYTILLSQAVFLPSMLLGGLMVPLSMFSGIIERVAWMLPASHAMNAFNSLSMGFESGLNPYASLAMLAASGLVSYTLAHLFYNWDRRNTRRRSHPALTILALLPFLGSLI